jgi:hypothetical protein
MLVLGLASISCSGDGGASRDSAVAGTNSGAICDSTHPCSSGESCILFNPSLTKGMCLHARCVIGSPCQVPDPSRQRAACVFSYGGGTVYKWDAGATTTIKVNTCGFYCEHEGASYDCPDPSSSFDCSSLDPTLSSKFCVPKE